MIRGRIHRNLFRTIAFLGAAGSSACSPAAEQPRLLTPGHDVPVERNWFGLFIHDVGRDADWPGVTFGSLRLWDARVTWADLQPAPRSWSFARLDSYVDRAAAHDVEIVLPLALTPAWASARNREPSAYGPGRAAEPRDRGDWQTYVRRVVERYRGRIGFYNVWDEPNQRTFFSGRIDALVALACDTYRLVKEIDPAALVISPPPTGKDEGIEWLDEYFAAGGAECTDIVGFNFFTWEADPPEEIGRLALAVREVMERHELGGKELWNTGTGRYIANARAPNAKAQIVLGDERAAAYVIRTFAVAAASGIRRSFWYAWDNRELGLIEPDTRAPKAAARAYDTAARWLVGATVHRCEQTLDDTWVCAITKRDATAELRWAPDGRRVTVAPPLEFGYRYDLGADDTAGWQATAIASPDLIVTEMPVLLTNVDRWLD